MNCAAASTTCRSTFSASAKMVRTWAISPRRSRPLSTKMQCTRLPMARASRAATTDESTPPDRAQITCSSGPTWAATVSSCCCKKVCMVHTGAMPATPNKKASSSSMPRGEWVTSG